MLLRLHEIRNVVLIGLQCSDPLMVVPMLCASGESQRRNAEPADVWSFPENLSPSETCPEELDHQKLVVVMSTVSTWNTVLGTKTG